MTISCIIKDLLVPMGSLLIGGFEIYFLYQTYQRAKNIDKRAAQKDIEQWNRQELIKLFEALPVNSLEEFFSQGGVYQDQKLFSCMEKCESRLVLFQCKENINMQKLIETFIKEFTLYLVENHYVDIPNQAGKKKFEPIKPSETYNYEEEQQVLRKHREKIDAFYKQYQEIKQILIRHNIELSRLENSSCEWYSYHKKIMAVEE